MAMVKVKYVGKIDIVGPTHQFWLPGETYTINENELTALRAKHGDVFVVQGGSAPVSAPEPASEVPSRRKK